LDVKGIDEDIFSGVSLLTRLSRCEPSWKPPPTTMSRRKQGKPQHLSKRDFSRK